MTTMESMFNEAKLFDSSLKNWDVARVTTMTWMFRYAQAFNGDVSPWVSREVVFAR